MHPGIMMVPTEQKWVWKFGNYDHYNDRLTPDQLTDKASRYIRRRFEKYQRKAGPDRRVGEKTNCNALRVAYVHSVFPDAKIIHMLRDGRAAATSSSQYWKDPFHFTPQYSKIFHVPFTQKLRMIGAYAGRRIKRIFGKSQVANVPWGPCFDGIKEAMETHSIIEVCGLQWRRLVEAAHREGMALGPERYYECRYERFCAHPQEALDELLDFLEVAPSQELREWAGENIHNRAVDAWRQRISDEDLASLMAQITPTLREFGFLDAAGQSVSNDSSCSRNLGAS